MATQQIEVKPDERMYFECRENGSHKFYQVSKFTNHLVLQWGPIGAKGHAEFKTYPNEGLAFRNMERKIQEKLSRGYTRLSGRAPFPDGVVEKLLDIFEVNTSSPEAKSDIDPMPGQNQEYFLQWKTDTPISPEALKNAAVLAGAIIDQSVELHTNHRLEVRHDLKEHVTRFFLAGEQVAAFGYPPSAFLESLTSRERKAVMELGTSRDGWLAQNGTGTGIIVTGKKIFDFPVRLYLSVLAVHNDLHLTCSDELEYGTRGLEVTADHSVFEWYPFWKSLKPIVEQHWFVQGQTRVKFTDEQAAASQFAW